MQTTAREDDRCQLIILNACYSDETARKLWEELEYSVSVVGHTGPVPDAAAVCFSGNFYKSLGELNSFEDAFKAGAAAAATGGPEKSTKYVLYASRHAKDFKLQKPKSEEEILKEENHKRLQQELDKKAAVEREQRNTQNVTERLHYETDLLHQQLWGKRFESLPSERDLCRHCGKHRDNNHFAAPGHPNFCNSLDGKSYEKDPNSNAPTLECCGLDSVFGLGAPCKNCLRPKHKHFPAAQGGSTVKACNSLDLYTSCKPTHSDIPFAVLCGPSVCCACPVPEYLDKMLRDEMIREQNLQRSGWGWVSPGWRGTGCSFRTFIVLLVVSLLFIYIIVIWLTAAAIAPSDASKDQSSSASDTSIKIVIISSVPIMMLVATGYRWVQWKREKQILEKFLSEEEFESSSEMQ